MPRGYSKRYFLSVPAVILILLFSGCSSVRERYPLNRFMGGQKAEGEERKSDPRVKSPAPRNVKSALSSSPVWNKSIDSEGLSSPAHFENSLYVGYEKGLLALTLESGKRLWRFKTPYPVQTPPAVSDRLICFGTSEGVLYCLDRKSGKELWHYQARSGLVSAPLITGDTVYFTSSDMKLCALALETGEKLWTYSRRSYTIVSPMFNNSPILSNGKLFVMFPDGYLVSLTPDTGRVLWEKRVLDEPILSTLTRGTPVVLDTVLYVMSDEDVLLEIEGDTGKAREVFHASGAVDFTVTDRTVFIATREEVMAVDLNKGKALWRRPVSRGEGSSIFAAGGHVFVLSYYTHKPFGFGVFARKKGHLEALSQADGTSLFKRRLNSPVPSSGTASARYFSYVTSKGTLEVFGPKR
jgi:outer membrane protein assembly factor BamB